MVSSKKYLLYGAAFVWALVIVGAALLLCFPYQRALRIMFEDVAGSAGSKISYVGAGTSLAKAKAAKIIVGHDALEGTPLYELDKVSLTWNPLSLIKGGFDMTARGVAYGGPVELRVSGMSVFLEGSPKLTVAFSGVNLGAYPGKDMSWFSGIKGTMSGTITKEIRFTDSAKEKGTFQFTLRDGEFRGINLQESPELSLPFKEVAITGKIVGNTWEIEKVSVTSDAFVAKGSGAITKAGRQTEIGVKLNYGSLSSRSPLAGKGTIVISGNLWSPEIAHSKEGASRSVGEFEKSAFFRKFKAKSKRSEPLKTGGTGFTYVYQDRENKDAEVEVELAPEAGKIDSVRVSWKPKQGSPAPEFTAMKEEFLKDLLLSLNPKADADGVASYAGNQQGRKYPQGESSMSKENIGNLSVRAGVIGGAFVVIVSFQP